MRLMAILVLVAGLSAVGASPAAAQLPEVPLPDLPVPEVPDVEPPEPDDGGSGGGGGSSPVPSVETPSTEGSSGSGGGGSGGGGSGGGGSGGGGSGGGGSGSGEGSGSDSCPCAAPATGYPVSGDYDKCPLDDGAPGAARADTGTGLAASRSDGSSGDDANGAGGVLGGAGVFGDDASQPPAADGALLGEDSEGSLLVGAVLALAGLGLLVGIGGGLRAWLLDRRGFP